jgi:hypothetical protein
VTAPRFHCTADEPPAKAGGTYGPVHRLDSTEGLILDEFVFEDVIHLEALHDRPPCYHLRVGGFVFIVTRRSGAWLVRLEEAP